MPHSHGSSRSNAQELCFDKENASYSSSSGVLCHAGAAAEKIHSHDSQHPCNTSIGGLSVASVNARLVRLSCSFCLDIFNDD